MTRLKLIAIAVVAVLTVLASVFLPGYIPLLDVEAYGVTAVESMVDSLR